MSDDFSVSRNVRFFFLLQNEPNKSLHAFPVFAASQALSTVNSSGHCVPMGQLCVDFLGILRAFVKSQARAFKVSFINMFVALLL